MRKRDPEENIQDMEEPSVTIRVLNSIECAVTSKNAIWFQHELEFPYVWYRPANPKMGIHQKQRMVYNKSAFSYQKGDVWKFYTGLLPRIKRVCKDSNIELTIQNENLPFESETKPVMKYPKVHGLTLRMDQLKIIDDLLAAKRGCCVAPTAYGKTVVMLGLISCFPKHRILIMVDKKAIVDQTFERFDEEFADVVKIHGTSKPKEKGRITIATKQSIVNMVKNNEIHPQQFDILIVDEVHHVSTFEGQYAKILKFLRAPYRFGFTGTYPDEEKNEQVLSVESFIGPIISEISPQEAEDLDLIATAKVQIVREEKIERFKNMNWQQTNSEAVVNNYDHNIAVAQASINEMDAGRTVLVFVNTVDHMLNIYDMIIEAAPDLTVKKVHSSVGREIMNKMDMLETSLKHARQLRNDERVKEIQKEINKWRLAIKNLEQNTKKQNQYKQWLIEKKINGVIATSTWREGVDIPTLDTVVLAAGGKEAQKVLQEIGRGHRMAEGKSHFKIIDFFNPSNKYLIEHFGLRMCGYLDRKWEFVYE